MMLLLVTVFETETMKGSLDEESNCVNRRAYSLRNRGLCLRAFARRVEPDRCLPREILLPLTAAFLAAMQLMASVDLVAALAKDEISITQLWANCVEKLGFHLKTAKNFFIERQLEILARGAAKSIVWRRVQLYQAPARK